MVVVSIDTFTKRKKTTHILLESHFLFSVRSALNQLEPKLIGYDTKCLNSDYCIRRTILPDCTDVAGVQDVYCFTGIPQPSTLLCIKSSTGSMIEMDS